MVNKGEVKMIIYTHAHTRAETHTLRTTHWPVVANGVSDDNNDDGDGVMHFSQL